MESNAIEAAGRLSKVTKKAVSNKQHIYWIGGAVVAVGLVMLFSRSHSSTIVKTPPSELKQMDFNATLNANLARLRMLEQNQQVTSTQNNTMNTFSGNTMMPLVNSHHSKEYIARQNAPTSMYVNPMNQSIQSTSSKTNNSITQATFAGKGMNAQFANTNSITSTVQATRIPHPRDTIAEGEFLHAVLETAIDSDLPGMVRAVVSRPVYSYTGEKVLIPGGSRLIGQYSAAIVQGQSRVMVVWNRVVLPNGVSVQINSPGTDALGRAGQGADSVNTHFLARFGQSALLSIIGAGAGTGGVSSSDSYNSASQYRMAIAQSFQQSAQQSLQGTQSIKPTLHIYQGANINVFVAHDLSFYAALKNRQ